MKKIIGAISIICILLIGCYKTDPAVLELLKQIQNQNEALKIQVASMQKTTDSLSIVLKASFSISSNMDKKIDSIRNQLSSLIIQVNTLSSQLNQANANIIDLQKRIAELQAKCQEMVEMLRLLTGTIKLSDGLIAYYPFTGNAGDSSGNNNHGIVNGATLTTDRFGNANAAYSFNGIDNNISAPHSNALNLEAKNIFTVAYWIKPRTLSQTQAMMIILKQTGVGFNQKGWNSFIEPNFKTQCYIRNGLGQPYSFANSGLVSVGVFYHVIHTFDNGKMKIILNGIAYGEEVFNNVVIGDNDAPLLIGKAPWVSSNTKGFDGIIDDIRIYNRALTQAEINYLASH